jgi:hypothetical protein
MPSRLAILLAALFCCPGLLAAEEAAARRYLSIDYTVHGTFKGAVRNSFAPTDYRANVGAVLKNTIEPLNPVRYVGAVAIVELQKQLASGEGLDLGKVVKKLDPAGLTGGYFGAQLGETLGAVAQTALARSMGPVGGTFGFALRPILWLAGSSIGAEVGRGVARGDKGDPLKQGMAVALREFNPIVDSAQMIGDNVGGVIGQAMIPVPFVGLMVGSAVGGVTGLLLGKAVTRTGPGKALDEHLRATLGGKADELAPDRRPKPGPATTAVNVPTINGATGARAPAPVDRPEARRAYAAFQEAVKRNDAALTARRLEEYRKAKEGR